MKRPQHREKRRSRIAPVARESIARGPDTPEKATPKTRLPVMPVQCSTCPFRPKGWTEVRGLLVARILTEGSPVCHSTGELVADAKRVRKEEHACRGARNFAQRFLTECGFLEAATDAAWDKKLAAIEREERRENGSTR